MAKLCPICDSQISGTFCRVCKRFVTPVYFKEDIHLNTRHAEHDFDCDFHGNTIGQDMLYHGTDADKCKENPFEKENIRRVKKTNASVSVFILMMGIVIMLSVAVAIFSDKKEVSVSNGNPIPEDKVYVTETVTDSGRDLYDELKKKYDFDEFDQRELTEKQIRDEGIVSNWVGTMGMNKDEAYELLRQVCMESLDNLKMFLYEPYTYEYSYWYQQLNKDGSLENHCEVCDYATFATSGHGGLGNVLITYDLLTEEVEYINITNDDTTVFRMNDMKRYVADVLQALGAELDPKELVYEKNNTEYYVGDYVVITMDYKDYYDTLIYKVS